MNRLWRHTALGKRWRANNIRRRGWNGWRPGELKELMK